MSYYKLISEAMYDPDHDLVFEHAKEADKELEAKDKLIADFTAKLEWIIYKIENTTIGGVDSAVLNIKEEMNTKFIGILRTLLTKEVT